MPIDLRPPPDEGAIDPPEAGADDRAVIIVHGIGEQRQYSVLNLLAWGLQRVGASRPQLQDSPSPFGQPLEPTLVRLRYNGCNADLYEVYWAPRASRKTTSRSVLSWLLRLTFLPPVGLRGRRRTQPRLKALSDRAIIATALVIIASFLLMALFAAAVIVKEAQCRSGRTQPPAWCRGALEAVGAESGSNYDVFRPFLALQAVRYALSLGVFQDLTMSELNPQRPFRVFADLRVWQLLVLSAAIWLFGQLTYSWLSGLTAVGLGRKAAAFVYMPAAVLLAWAAADISHHLRPEAPLSNYLVGVAATLLFTLCVQLVGTRRWHRTEVTPDMQWRPRRVGISLALLMLLLPAVPAVLLALMLVLVPAYAVLMRTRRFLAESVGDIQVYTTRDANNPLFEVRESVLEAAEETFALVSRRGYRDIVVIGHSLGSVIAFDALYALRRRVPELLPSVHAIITIGTALEKVRYFFSQPELLDPGLSRADQSSSDLARRRVHELDRAVELGRGRAWLNLWYANDIVADAVTTFGEDPAGSKRHHLGGWRHWPLPTTPPPSNEELIAESETCLVVNCGLGWRWKYRLFWPHSDYLIDKEVLTVIRDCIFRRTGSGRGQADPPGRRC